MEPKDPAYAPLRQYDIDEGESLYSDSPTATDESVSSFVTRLRGEPKGLTNTIYRWEWLTRGILCFLSTVFFTLWIVSAYMHKCTYVAKYFPANEAVEYIEHVKYKGSLHFTTPWRGDESGNPSSDIDAAWRRISTDVKPISVTEEQLHMMGIAVTPTMVKVPEEGGGYLASLEVTHHLQCLDMLRKATYREHYQSFDPAFQVEGKVFMNQLDTCVELIRQAFMCYPDINMMTYYWVRDHKSPYPNSNTVHRCKNFDGILDWAASNAANVPRPSHF